MPVNFLNLPGLRVLDIAISTSSELLARSFNVSDEAAMLLTQRFFGKVTPAVREAWPTLRRTKHISVHAARRILAQAEAIANPPDRTTIEENTDHDNRSKTQISPQGSR